LIPTQKKRKEMWEEKKSFSTTGWYLRKSAGGVLLRVGVFMSKDKTRRSGTCFVFVLSK